MRRSLALLPFLIALAVLMSALPVVARTNIAVGWSVPEGGGHDPAKVMAEVDKYVAQVGRNPAVWGLWSRWGDRGANSNGPCVKGVGSCSFPTASVAALQARGITPMIWWVFVDPKNPRENRRYAQYNKINNGVHDSYIRDWARAARNVGKVTGKPVIIRFAHEADGHWFPWSISAGQNTPRNYKKAWARLWNKFNKVYATKHVRWLWSAIKPQKINYPGNKFVNYVGLTVLNFGNPPKTWKPAKKALNQKVSLARKVTKKPMIVSEMGTSHLGGDKGDWIDTLYKHAYWKQPKIKAIVYLQAPHDPVEGPDWQLSVGDGGAGLNAYKRIANNPKFKGKIR